MTQQNIGIGTITPNSSALLEVQSSNKGLLIPRINLTSEVDATTIPAPPVSLLIYNLNSVLPEGVGYYYWNGTRWTKLISKDGLTNVAWGINGNAGTTPPGDFIGTTDNTPLVFKVSNTLSGKIDPALDNTFWGERAGSFITTGTKNFLGGVQAGYRLESGERNVFIGYLAGNDNDSGSNNVAIGNEALASTTINTKLKYYIAIGNRAGYNAAGANGPGFPTQTEMSGIFIGTAAGYNGPSGIAIGDSASYLFSDYRNIAIGVEALKRNSGGALNIGIGFRTLMGNTTGDYNLALGQFALLDNTTGEHNVAIGNNALDDNISGNDNTAIGANSGVIATNLSNTTAIGHNAFVSTSNTMVFGDAAVDRWAFGISTTSAQHALEVGVNGTDGNGAYLTEGGTWTNTSSRTKKEDFSEINGTDLMQKLKALRIHKWKYINSEEYHIGPVSEDFYDLFGLGTDDKGISTVDPAGISLAAIKELIKDAESLRKELQLLKTEIAELKKGNR